MKNIVPLFFVFFVSVLIAFFSTPSSSFACGEDDRKIFYATPDGVVDRFNFDENVYEHLIEKGVKIGTCGTKCMYSDLHIEDRKDSVEARVVAACQAYEKEKYLRKKEEEKEKDRFIKNFLNKL